MIVELLGLMEEQLGGRRMDGRQEEKKWKSVWRQQELIDEQEGPAPKLDHQEEQERQGAGRLGLKQYIAQHVQHGAAVRDRGAAEQQDTN